MNKVVKFWGGCVNPPSQFKLKEEELKRDGVLHSTHKTWVFFGCLWFITFEDT